MKAKPIHIFLPIIFLFLITPGMLFAKDSPIQIKYAHIGPPLATEPMHASALSFKYMMEKETASKYKVDVYPAGTLGKELDLMESVKNGVIQVLAASMGGLHRIYPPAILAFAPYVFKNEAVATEVIKGPFGQKLLDDFTAKTGIKGLAYNDIYTFLAFTNKVRPILSPADMQGLKFRAMDTLQVNMFKALGASAVPVSLSEVYTALQTGVVDGQTNPALLVAALKWYEVQKYISLSASQFGYQWLVCNKQWYDKLSPEDKNALHVAIKAAQTASSGVGIVQESINIAALQEKGMTVTLLSEAQKEEFAKLAKPECLKWLKTQMDPKIVDEFLGAIDMAEKKLGY